MSNTTETPNPMEFFKSLWGNMGIPLPGMVTPTVDTDELGRRIADLKAVEGWLKGNLSMLQMTIQGFEMQRATLMAIQAMTQPAAEGQQSEANPFANPALWSWGFTPPAPTENDAAPKPPVPEPSAPEAPESSAPKRKPKR